MNLSEAITILEQHNDWRRGAETPMAAPSVIGEALDLLISHAKMAQADPIRTTCYSSLVAKAAEALTLPVTTSADDVLRAVIAGQKRNTTEEARRLVLAALAKYEHA